MIYFAAGSEKTSLSNEDMKNGLFRALDKLGNRKKILAIPPDMTRFHSHAGELTIHALDYYGITLTDILPALGTHAPMTPQQIRMMYKDIPLELFREHNWREDIVTLGTVPEEYVRKVSEGKASFRWPAQVNRVLPEGGYDLILSIGQVVPHEVSGMANYNKNIFVGTGGVEGINKSHYLGALYGMEKIMGRADNPVRKVLQYASDHFSDSLPAIVYVLTVIEQKKNGRLVTRGLFVGDDAECFYMASRLSAKVNIDYVDEPLEKVVVYLDPAEYRSTWLGNKAIYRTRMAMADDGELIILAPGVKEFGEDTEIDHLIRKYGYRGTPYIIDAVKHHTDLADNLAAAAHLIHGSSEGRFNITYCPGKLSRKEIESVGFRYDDLNIMMKKYNPDTLKEGKNVLSDGEKIFYISNPALGLWTTLTKFNKTDGTS